MSARKQTVDAIFITALKFNDAQMRNLFLESACAGDQELRELVEKLLATQSDDLFEAVAPAFTLTAEDLDEAAKENVFQESYLSDGRIGSRVGHYRLLERIGEGGCGSVYLAEQEEPVRRRVAFKIIKPGMDTKSVISRFEGERQALALMDHPSILKVLDAGTTQNERPFFVMELVDGLPITRFCDQHNLNTLQRLELFAGVCHAIQHAHQKGIIHRDIKPSNILVSWLEGKPLPHVIDFGIAKATQGHLSDATLCTRPEQLIGTPAYMSPEQAETGGLDVDTRTDIYSLGVLLYELLTGKTPLDAETLARSGLDVLRRKLRELDPPRPSVMLTTLHGSELDAVAHHRQLEPSQLVSQLRGDLDWIVMKALEKNRNRRYATANGLADDVQRYLNNEPVSARPPSQLYQFQKLVRRNRTLFISGALVALSVLAGFGVSTSLFFREKEARQEQARLRVLAENARASEARLLSQAQARERLARAAVLLRQDKVEEADTLLAKTPFDSISPSMEAAGVLRAIGEWNASYGRWQQAVDCFTALMQANLLAAPEQIAGSSDLLLPGPALLESGDEAGYEKFRSEVLNRFGDCTNSPVAAEHMIKISLLLPAGEAVLQRLEPFAQTVAGSLSDRTNVVYHAWSAAALAMLDYRRSNFTNALSWAQKCLQYPDTNAASLATSHCLMALAWQRLGLAESARSELAQARSIAAGGFLKPGVTGNMREGFWFDWVVVRRLLSEAATGNPP